MDGTTFDSLGFSKMFLEAGFTQVQAEALARFALEQEYIRKAERKAEQEKLEAEHRNTLATKADVEKVRADVEKVRADLSIEIEKVRGEMMLKIKDTEVRLIKWMLGIACIGGGAMFAVMAKGFGWLGF